MCGIAGILFKGEHPGMSAGQALIDMLDGCQHRGPDSTGFADVAIVAQIPRLHDAPVGGPDPAHACRCRESLYL